MERTKSYRSLANAFAGIKYTSASGSELRKLLKAWRYPKASAQRVAEEIQETTYQQGERTMSNIKIAEKQVYVRTGAANPTETTMEILYAGDSKAFVLYSNGVENMVSLSFIPERYTLSKHQSGCTLDHDAYEYREFASMGASAGYDCYKNGIWIGSSGAAADEYLYRRPKSLLEKYDLEVGGLYYRSLGYALFEVLNEASFMVHSGSEMAALVDITSTAMPKDRKEWRKVARDSKEAIRYLGEVKKPKSCGYVDHPVIPNSGGLESKGICLDMWPRNPTFCGYVFEDLCGCEPVLLGQTIAWERDGKLCQTSRKGGKLVRCVAVREIVKPDKEGA